MRFHVRRLHRWVALICAMPWIVILLTGLLLSLEPMAMDPALRRNAVTLAALETAIAKHDPAGKANTLNVRAYDNAILLSEGRGKPSIRIDLATGAPIAREQRLWSDVLGTARRLHENLLLDMKWLVDAVTIAMLVSILLGLLLGLPRLRNSLAGWHQVAAWVTLPLLILSPLTGLAIAYGITLSGPPPKLDGPPVSLIEAVRVVAAKHDLAGVYWIRPMGGVLRARIYDGGQAKVFGVTRAGLVGSPQSWPRILHEGNWLGLWSGALNILTSLVLIGMLATGLVIWGRPRWRRRSRTHV